MNSNDVVGEDSSESNICWFRPQDLVVSLQRLICAPLQLFDVCKLHSKGSGESIVWMSKANIGLERTFSEGLYLRKVIILYCWVLVLTNYCNLHLTTVMVLI